MHAMFKSSMPRCSRQSNIHSIAFLVASFVLQASSGRSTFGSKMSAFADFQVAISANADTKSKRDHYENATHFGSITTSAEALHGTHNHDDSQKEQEFRKKKGLESLAALSKEEGAVALGVAFGVRIRPRVKSLAAAVQPQAGPLAKSLKDKAIMRFGIPQGARCKSISLAPKVGCTMGCHCGFFSQCSSNYALMASEQGVQHVDIGVCETSSLKLMLWALIVCGSPMACLLYCVNARSAEQLSSTRSERRSNYAVGSAPNDPDAHQTVKFSLGCN